MIFVGFKGSRLVIDEFFGKLQQFPVRFDIVNILEIAVRFPDFIGIAQRFQDHAIAAWLQADDMFLSPHRELAHADFFGFSQGIAQHDIGFLGKIIRGNHIIGLFVIEHVDVGRIDKLGQDQRLPALQLDRVDFVLIEQDVAILFIFKTLDDLVPVDGSDARHDLFIFDSLA